MARARMVEVNYYNFRQLLREAADRGALIDKRAQVRWQAYIKVHNLNEVAAMVIARSRFEKPTPVIVDLGSAQDGLYLYSDLEEGCLRLVPHAGSRAPA